MGLLCLSSSMAKKLALPLSTNGRVCALLLPLLPDLAGACLPHLRCCSLLGTKAMRAIPFKRVSMRLLPLLCASLHFRPLVLLKPASALPANYGVTSKPHGTLHGRPG